MHRNAITALIAALLLFGVLAGGCARRHAPPETHAPPTPETETDPLDYPTVTAPIPIEDAPATIVSRPPPEAAAAPSSRMAPAT